MAKKCYLCGWKPRFWMRGLKYKIITVLAVFVMPFCAEVSGQSFNTLNPGMGDFNDMNFQTPGGIGANPFQTEEGPLDSARMDTTKKERKPLESYFFNDSFAEQLRVEHQHVHEPDRDDAH